MFNKQIFKEDLIKFFKDALIICEDNFDKIASDDLKWPIFFSTGKYKTFITNKNLDYDYFISREINTKIIQLQSYNVLKKFFVGKEFQNYNMKALGNIYDSAIEKPNFAINLPLKFLIEYLQTNKGHSYNKKNLNVTFEKFFSFLENMLEDEYVAPLFNFKSNIDKKVMIINNIGIRKINALEFYRFTNLNDNSNLSSIFHNLTHVMFTTHSGHDLNSGYDVVETRFQLLLDSLLLFTVGNPQFGTIFRNINTPWIHYDSGDEKDVTNQSILYFDKKQKRKVESIFNSLSVIDFSKKENRFLDIAIRRFGSALSRTDNIDQLIDLMISVESLLVSGSGETSVKLSTRLSTLLAKNDKQRVDYWLFAKKAYNVRSGIVHGEDLRSTEINGKTYTLEEILNKLVNLTRELILIYLKLVNKYSGKKKNEKICEDIDKALMNKTFLKELKTKFN